MCLFHLWINNIKVLGVTKTLNAYNEMILINKNALNLNVPNKDTYISHHHRVVYRNKLVEAQYLVNNNNILKVPMEKQVL